MITLLGQLAGAPLLERFIAGVVTREYDGSENEALAANAQRLGPIRLGLLGDVEVPPELALQHAVHPLDLLLLAQLDAVVRELDAQLPVLAGGIGALHAGALAGVALHAFQEEVRALPPAQPRGRPGIASH